MGESRKQFVEQAELSVDCQRHGYNPQQLDDGPCDHGFLHLERGCALDAAGAYPCSERTTFSNRCQNHTVQRETVRDGPVSRRNNT
jgi:hypothetical protein